MNNASTGKTRGDMGADLERRAATLTEVMKPSVKNEGHHVEDDHSDRRRNRLACRRDAAGAIGIGSGQVAGSARPRKTHRWHRKHQPAVAFPRRKGCSGGFRHRGRKIIAAGLFGDANKIEFVNQASDARIPNIVTGKVDIACQFVTVTAARAQQVAFTVPYYREGVSLMMVKGGKYADYAALKAAGNKVTVSGSSERVRRRHGEGCASASQGRSV